MRALKLLRTVSIVMAAVFFSNGSFLAQKLDLKFEPTTAAGAENNLKLRESPPSEGFLFVRPPGRETFTINKDQKVTITDSRVVSTLFGNSVWVKVTVPGQAAVQQREGWAYWGPSIEKSSNFAVVKAPK